MNPLHGRQIMWSHFIRICVFHRNIFYGVNSFLKIPPYLKMKTPSVHTATTHRSELVQQHSKKDCGQRVFWRERPALFSFLASRLPVSDWLEEWLMCGAIRAAPPTVALPHTETMLQSSKCCSAGLLVIVRAGTVRVWCHTEGRTNTRSETAWHTAASSGALVLMCITQKLAH